MNKRTSMYLSSGILGLTGAAMVGLSANPVQAATKGVVNYTGGLTTVWNSPIAGQKPQRYLHKGDAVTIQSTKKVYQQTWYNLGNNEWVASQYINTDDNAQVANQPAPKDSNTNEVAAAPQTTITINYQGGLTTVWKDPSFYEHTGRYLAYGAKVNIINQKKVNGAVWYQLADQGWVPGEFATLNQAASVNNTTANAPSNTQPTITDADATQQASQPVATSYQATAGQTASAANAAQTVINAALGQVGTPYVWGGATPGQGLDCSGLVQYAFAQANVSMSHYTVAQESMGQRISLSELQPGDILFWGDAGASYHDAVYIGNNQYVHAPQPGETVKVGTISSYFMPSFGVRVF